jgi:hypothetical protein
MPSASLAFALRTVLHIVTSHVLVEFLPSSAAEEHWGRVFSPAVASYHLVSC